MPQLSPEIINRLCNVFLHLVETTDERQALVARSLSDPHIEHKIKYEGNSITFFTNLAKNLFYFGEIQGQNALITFIEAARKEVGHDKQDAIDHLVIDINKALLETRFTSQSSHQAPSEISMTLNTNLSTTTSNERRLLSLFDIGFYGTNIENALNLVLGKDGGFYDYPDDTEAIISLIQSCGLVLFSKQEYEAFFGLTQSLLHYLFLHNYPDGEIHARWGTAIPIAKKIERSVLNLEYRLSRKELATVVLGEILGAWYFKDRKLSDEARMSLIDALKVLTSEDAILKSVNEQIERYSETKFVTPDPVRVVHSLIRRLIMFQS